MVVNSRKLKNAISNNIKNYFAKDKTVFDNLNSLFNLLFDHPVYIERAKRVRGIFLLPKDTGLLSGEEALVWENDNGDKLKKLRDAVTKLLTGFAIPEAFRDRVFYFTYDYIISKNSILSLLVENFDSPNQKDEGYKRAPKLLSFRTVHTLPDRELNKYLLDTNALYLQIGPGMNLATLQKVYTEVIMKNKEQLLPLEAPSPEEKARLIWRMRMEKFRPKKIIEVLKIKYIHEPIKIDHHFVKTNTYRYTKALQTLKMFDPKKYL